jgi:hypothetical protein
VFMLWEVAQCMNAWLTLGHQFLEVDASSSMVIPSWFEAGLNSFFETISFVVALTRLRAMEKALTSSTFGLCFRFHCCATAMKCARGSNRSPRTSSRTRGIAATCACNRERKEGSRGVGPDHVMQSKPDHARRIVVGAYGS